MPRGARLLVDRGEVEFDTDDGVLRLPMADPVAQRALSRLDRNGQVNVPDPQETAADNALGATTLDLARKSHADAYAKTDQQMRNSRPGSGGPPQLDEPRIAKPQGQHRPETGVPYSPPSPAANTPAPTATPGAAPPVDQGIGTTDELLKIALARTPGRFVPGGPVPGPTTTQHGIDIDPADKQRLDDAGQSQRDAIDEHTAAQLARNEERQHYDLETREIEREHAQRALDLEKKIKAEVDTRIAKMDATIKEAEKATTDPNRFWNSKSGFSKAMTIFSMATGGALQQINGMASNPAVDLLNKQIDRDIDVQLSNQKNLRSSLSDQQSVFSLMMKEFGDEQLALDAQRVAQLRHAKAQWEFRLREVRDGEAKARGEAAKAALEEEIANRDIDLKAKAQDKVVSVMNYRPGRVVGGGRHPLGKLAEKILFEREKARLGTAGNQAVKADELAKEFRTVMNRDNQGAKLLASKESLKKIQEITGMKDIPGAGPLEGITPSFILGAWKAVSGSKRAALALTLRKVFKDEADKLMRMRSGAGGSDKEAQRYGELLSQVGFTTEGEVREAVKILEQSIDYRSRSFEALYGQKFRDYEKAVRR